MNHRPLGLALASAAALSAPASWAATEYGTVISSTPVVAHVAVTSRECTQIPVSDAPAARRAEPSGAGAVVGALVGAALGSAFGKGSGRVAAAGVGMVAGAALGNQAEAQEAERQAATAPAQRCHDITRQEARAVGYDVVYEYQGVRRTVRLAQPPGERIALEVQVVPAGQVSQPVYNAPLAAPAARPAYRTPADTVVVDDAARGGYAPYPPAAPVQASAGSSDALPYLLLGGLGAWAIINATSHHHHHVPARVYRRR